MSPTPNSNISHAHNFENLLCLNIIMQDDDDEWQEIYAERVVADENEGFTDFLTYGGGPEGGFRKYSTKLVSWHRDWFQPAIETRVDGVLEFTLKDGIQYLRVVYSNPETLHNLVRYFKFCLFGTVWGHTAHATDPRTGIRL